MTDWASPGDSRVMPGRIASSLPRFAVAGTSRPPELLDLATVYDENFHYVWRCLKSLGVPASQLDDVVQEVFLVVQRKLPEFDGAAPVRTWLYAIALRMARRARREAARDARHLAPGDWDADTPARASSEASLHPRGDLHRDLERQERLTLAHRALSRLDDAKREVFVLSHIEQMPTPELARLFGVPLNTAYSRVRLAKQAFQAAVRELCEEVTPSARVERHRLNGAPSGRASRDPTGSDQAEPACGQSGRHASGRVERSPKWNQGDHEQQGRKS